MKIVKAKKEEAKKEIKITQIGFVSECKDYNIFDNWNDIKTKNEDGSFNRKTQQRKDIINSMRQIGFLGTLIAFQTKAFGGVKTLLADGNHRLLSLKDLASEGIKLAFNYQLNKLADDTKENLIAVIMKLNETGVRWNSLTYLKNMVALGVREYIKFYKLLKEPTLTYKDLFCIFSVTSKDFRSGEMKFKNENESNSLLQSILTISKVIPNIANCRRAIFHILKLEDISHKTLAKIIVDAEKQMAKKGEEFSGDEITFRGEIMDLMNLKSKKTLKVA